MSEKISSLKTFGWLGTIAGLTTFLLINDEMAALLFWVGLGMLAHSTSRRAELSLWNVFATAKHPFRLSLLLLLIGAPLFWAAHLVQSRFVRNLFEPLGALLILLAIASFVAAILAWQSRTPSS